MIQSHCNMTTTPLNGLSSVSAARLEGACASGAAQRGSKHMPCPRAIRSKAR